MYCRGPTIGGNLFKPATRWPELFGNVQLLKDYVRPLLYLALINVRCSNRDGTSNSRISFHALSLLASRCLLSLLAGSLLKRSGLKSKIYQTFGTEHSYISFIPFTSPSNSWNPQLRRFLELYERRGASWSSESPRNQISCHGDLQL